MNKDCKMCEVVGGIFGLLLGAVLLFVSFDILTGGSLSTLISGGTPETPEEITSDDQS